MIQIRSATTDDITIIQDLSFRIWPETYSAILTSDQIQYMLDKMYSHASLSQQIHEGAIFLLAISRGIPVGFAAYQQTAIDTYKLHKLYVLPSQQGKGIGKQLINHIISSLSAPAKKIQLQVNRNNNAKLFYEKMGFTVIQEADFAIGNGYFMNDYVMEKKL